MRLIQRDVDEAGWREAALTAASGDADLVSLWGDEGEVRMALGWNSPRALDVLRLKCPNGRFPSVGALHAPAIRLERAVVDLYGFVAEGAKDDRPWLDHGRWPVKAPLGAAAPQEGEGGAYKFLAAEGHGLHQIPVGPVHAGVIEPGHFRFHASGETVVRLEERLGYLHKGVDALFRGADINAAASLAGRISGDSTVAYSIAFARAVEQALGISAAASRPPCARNPGRDRARRQPLWRHRRDLQRRRVLVDAGSLLGAARARFARRRRRRSVIG